MSNQGNSGDKYGHLYHYYKARGYLSDTSSEAVFVGEYIEDCISLSSEDEELEALARGILSNNNHGGRTPIQMSNENVNHASHNEVTHYVCGSSEDEQFQSVERRLPSVNKNLEFITESIANQNEFEVSPPAYPALKEYGEWLNKIPFISIGANFLFFSHYFLKENILPFGVVYFPTLHTV